MLLDSGMYFISAQELEFMRLALIASLLLKWL